MSNRNQDIPLPKKSEFNAREVLIRKVGDEVIVSPRPADWASYLQTGPVASARFLEGVEDLRVQEREP